MPDRWMCALGAIHALAYSATDSDRIMLTALCRLDIVRIDKITRMVDFTAKRNREFGRVLAGRRPVLRHRSGNGKESLTIGQLGSLQQQLFRRAECFVYVPAGTGAAVFGKLHAAGRQPFGNIAGIVNAQEEKRNAARMGGIQARQAVANLLEAGTKSASKQVQVMAKFTCRCQKAAIGHHHGTGEIPRKR